MCFVGFIDESMFSAGSSTLYNIKVLTRSIYISCKIYNSAYMTKSCNVNFKSSNNIIVVWSI